ncbi:hypothetical protein JR316_0005371 [Psilocybe cubensis]|uniref:Uncharacterized protein n=1 Tax=Psilocybe cubensis TaxID=181762 RepID=A0ACB8H6K6_PSICU|nr:hypothetical protein JR316_0005371 [Psilocybe cubensis]KAH9483267.1 hypothetical protein JR316_0005371 [Psilocybe cubensis]
MPGVFRHSSEVQCQGYRQLTFYDKVKGGRVILILAPQGGRSRRSKAFLQVDVKSYKGERDRAVSGKKRTMEG